METPVPAPVLALVARIRENTCKLLCMDGSAGTGKSTLASFLQRELKARVIHMDDYFSPDQSDLLDFERFCEEVSRPLAAGEALRLRAFSCKTHSLSKAVLLPEAALTVVEGAYCLHPRAGLCPDLKVFLTADKALRLSRIAARGGDRETFEARWMPREEAYFTEYSVPEHCDFRIDTTDFPNFEG